MSRNINVISKICLLVFLCFTMSCGKQDNANIVSVATDPIDLNFAMMIDSSETDTVSKFSDLVFDDGTNVKNFLNQKDPGFLNQYGLQKSTKVTSDLSTSDKISLLLARMQAIGFYMVTRSNHQYAQESDDKPAQNGLAYVFGSKQYLTREKATGSCSSDFRFGTDCSGMIYQMASQAGISLSSKPKDECNVAFLSNIENWNKAFKNSTDFSELRMYVASPTPSAINMKFGDIIVWSGHIGIVLNSRQLSIFQSNGYDNSDKCSQNGDNRHGPSIKKLSTGFLGAFGAYKVLRLADTLLLNLTNGSSKKWKPNPSGQTIYCGTGIINPAIAMDDIFTFNADGNFIHNGGTITVDSLCSDGGIYNSTWSFSGDRKSIIIGGGSCIITKLSSSNFQFSTPNGKDDLVPSN